MMAESVVEFSDISKPPTTKQKDQTFREKLCWGWKEWAINNPIAAYFAIFIVIACIIIVAVVPPVCILHGCGRGKQEELPYDDLPLRLLVHFDDITKTVKSKVPPFLYEYFDEIVLSFGVNIVDFINHKVLYEVQRLLESQPDVLVLVRDRPQYQIPTWNVSEIAALAADLTRRRELQAGAGDSALGDELTAQQWALDKVAARDAWSTSMGSGVIVAVVDSGCDLEHPDLKANLWQNEREIPGNGIDDDNNTYVDDVIGFDFAGPCENTKDPGCGKRPDATDTNGHGSHCSGIIGAVRNNRVGIVGVAPNVQIMCLKVVPNNNYFYTSHNLEAINYAINHGAHIISCSFGPGANSKVSTEVLVNETNLYIEALKKIEAKNMLLVAAAGNEMMDLDKRDYYNPCTMVRNFSRNVLCVAATDILDKRMEKGDGAIRQGSNWGKNTVSIAAPGSDILSTVPMARFNQSWANLSGSSMATPMVAGVAALVMSILGSSDGNYFKGPTARDILVDTGVTVENLDVVRNKRINARAAAEAALARLDNIYNLVIASFNASDQWAMMEGFNVTYYNLNNSNEVTQPIVNAARIEGYKNDTTAVLVTGYMNLTRRGLYAFKIRTNAKDSNLKVLVGQRTLRTISNTHILNSSGGWYDFQLQYTNPVEPIDILIADLSKGSNLEYAKSIFYIATATPPRNFFYGPNIALSSTWQVLTKHSTAPLTTSATMSSSLEIDAGYNSSVVLEGLDFTAMTKSALHAKLLNPDSTGTTTTNSTSKTLIGLALTRFRMPDEALGSIRFQVSCELCTLYVNGLRVMDVYDKKYFLQPVTAVSNCIAVNVNKSDVSTLHDLLLRFAVDNSTSASATTSLAVGWMPCNESAVRPLGKYLMINWFWQPSSGVAGYVGGMQCDVWLQKPDESVKNWAPLVKFRLPTALTQTKGLSAIRNNAAIYDNLYSTQCDANETIALGNCTASAGFKLSDVVPPLLSSTLVYMRCWTFVNAGFRDGLVRLHRPMAANLYLGAQKVLSSGSTTSINNFGCAPNTTTLGDYHQLLVMEFPGLRYSALMGMANGSTDDPVPIDMSRTLLPIPLIDGSATTTTGRNLRRQHRRLSAKVDHTIGGDVEDDNSSNGGGLPSHLEDIWRVDLEPRNQHHASGQSLFEDGQVVRTSADVHYINELRHADRRELQSYLPLYNNLYDPSKLGDSAYTRRPLPNNPGLCGFSVSMNKTYQDQTLNLQATFYNLSLTASANLGTPCDNCTVGLSDAVCPARSRDPQVLQFEGFLRVPNKSPYGTKTSTTSTTTMRRWFLQVVDQSVNTTINIGDVTVRNAVDYESSVTATETIIWLPYSSSRSSDNLFLPAVVSGRSKVEVGAPIVFNVALVPPDRSSVIRVNRSFWYCGKPNTCGLV